MLFPCSLLQADDFKIFLEKTRNKYNLPALGGTATLNGRIVRAEVSGFRKFRSGVATTLNDKFHIGSCTKSMTFFFARVLA